MFWLFSSLIGNASFGSSFGSWLRKKNKTKSFGGKVLGGPLEYQNKTCFGKTKSSYQNLFFHRDQPFPNIWRNNSIKNGIYVPPRRVVIASSPHLLSVPACHSLPRRLLPLWIHRFRQICPVFLRSPAESEVAYFTRAVVWWTRYVAFR
jgi:hypothetical protein